MKAPDLTFLNQSHTMTSGDCRNNLLAPATPAAAAASMLVRVVPVWIVPMRTVSVRVVRVRIMLVWVVLVRIMSVWVVAWSLLRGTVPPVRSPLLEWKVTRNTFWFNLTHRPFVTIEVAGLRPARAEFGLYILDKLWQLNEIIHQAIRPLHSSTSTAANPSTRVGAEYLQIHSPPMRAVSTSHRQN